MSESIPKPDPKEAYQYFKNKIDCSTGAVELNHWLDSGADINVIDVRRREDYEKGHVPGAVNLPPGEWGNTKTLAKDKTNVIYCYSQNCHLAASASVQFAEKGFPVVELDGGYDNWEKSGMPVRTDGKVFAKRTPGSENL